ncbi:MAG: NosD domain-containing protein [Candidatus Altiarchaeota archaeon]
MAKRNLNFWGFLVVGIFMFFLGNVSAISCTCSSCDGCTAALNDNIGCPLGVNLTADITNHAGTCINNPENFSNKIFDCQGHTIDGDGSGTDYGIYLNGKTGNTIKNCIITGFYRGIYLWSSSSNTLTSNTASSNYYGIYLYSSSNNTLTSNTASSNYYGIYLGSSSNNTLTSNTASSNSYGIYLGSSSNNTLTNNTASSNSYGIRLYSSSNNILTNNTASSNDKGIYLYSSSNNILTSNTASSNSYGIYLYSSSNNTLTNNTMNNNTYNFGIYGEDISHYYQDINTSNTVDGKPIYYWTNEKYAPNNCKNVEIDESSNAGFVALVSCENITVKNLNLNHNDEGILLVNTTNSKILNNNASSNGEGIYLYSSSNNNITSNIASSNGDGISLYSSSNNILTNNTANSNSNYGISLYSSSNNTLTNNTASSNGYLGIYLYSSSNNTLTNNTASSNSYGIYIFYNSNFNEILNNKISNNTKTGITISDCNPLGWCGNGNTNNTIENNEILNNKIGIFSQASNSTINGNTVCGNTNLDFNSSDWLLSNGDNNTCDKPDGWNDTGTTGCTYSCPVVCTCNSCSDCNAKLNSVSCTEVKLTADISDFAGTCIDNPSNFTNKIFDCQGYRIDGASSTSNQGIYLDNKSNNTIKNCLINDFYDGILLYPGSKNNTILNNTISNTTYGIRMSSSVNNTIEGNLIINNSKGLYVSDFGAKENLLRSNRVCLNGIDIDGAKVGLNYGYNNTCNTSDNWNDLSTWSCKYTCDGKQRVIFSFPFYFGWNLISVPLNFVS